MWWILLIIPGLAIITIAYQLYNESLIIDCAIVKVERVNGKKPMYCIGVYKDKKLKGFINTHALNNLILLKNDGYLEEWLSGGYKYIDKIYYSTDVFRTENIDDVTEKFNEIRFIMNLEENFVRITPFQGEKDLAKEEETFNKSRELTMQLIEAGRNEDEELELITLKELEKLHNESKSHE